MPAHDAEQIDAAFAQLAGRGVKALTINDPLMWLEHQRIADAALARGIAEQSWFREAVIAGSLFSYGVDLPYVARQSTEYVTRVLKGTSPAELPVVEPTRFEQLVNLKTASARYHHPVDDPAARRRGNRMTCCDLRSSR